VQGCNPGRNKILSKSLGLFFLRLFLSYKNNYFLT
jgi:hypothetical protein